jgi:N-acetyl-gamma-glutamyl-phosphate reductase
VEDYRDEPFVEVLTDRLPALVDVVGTNLVSIGVSPLAELSSPMLLVVSAEDNLVKGASGQAVQNFNLMFGFEESEGLRW